MHFLEKFFDIVPGGDGAMEIMLVMAVLTLAMLGGLFVSKARATGSDITDRRN